MDPDKNLYGACEVDVIGAGSRALLQASERLREPLEPSESVFPKALKVKLKGSAAFIKSIVSLFFTSMTELKEQSDPYPIS